MKTIPAPNACETCPARSNESTAKQGIERPEHNFLVALAGNPNTGKSTVFNNLTGLRQHTGNWPGKTVIRAEGVFSYRQHTFKIVDLPGTYSLLSTSSDEEIARNFLLFGAPDVTIVVVDATRLERNLNLALQILEITDRAVVCLNLIDEAARHRLKIDDRQLAKELGVPVVPTVARQKRGMDDLMAAVTAVATGKQRCRPHRIRSESKSLTTALDILVKKLEAQFPRLPNTRWVALRLLEGDARIIKAIRSGELRNLSR